MHPTETMDSSKLTYKFFDAETNAERLSELILYISSKCQKHSFFGKKKLNKILFFADFAAYLRYGESITGSAYIRQKWGPMPEPMNAVLSTLRVKGDLVFQHHLLFTKFEERPINRREPKLEIFRGHEIELVGSIISKFRSKTGKELSDLSHLYRLWKIYPTNELIPYEAAFISNEPVNDRDREILAELRAVHEW